MGIWVFTVLFVTKDVTLIEWGEIKAALLVHCNIIYEAFANNSIGLLVAYSTNTLIF